MTLAARLPADPLALPLRTKLAQLMIVRIGSDISPVRTADDDESRVATLLREAPIGGLLLFNGRHATTPAVLARLQQTSEIPLLVSSDIERGFGQQLRPFPLLPHAMAFQALNGDATDAARKFGELTAVASRNAGVHVTFAPVADVNTDPNNPIIATRAFSTDPHRAGELAAAFVDGCTTAGLLTTAKHFPGHGDTQGDSHHSLPTVNGTRAELWDRELVPFRATIAAGAPLVMTAHVSYPALDPSGMPATLSRPILTDLLRGEMGFQGAVVTDSLLMAGVRQLAATETELCVLALNAGVDLLLDLEHPVETLAGLQAAVDRGDLPEARVNEALLRVDALKRAAWRPDFGANSIYANCTFDELEHRTRQLAGRIAAAVVQINDRQGLTPLRTDRPLLTVLVNHYRSHIDPPQAPLCAALAERFAQSDFVELRGDEPPEQWTALAARALAVEQLLVAIVVKPAAWHRFGLPQAANDWLGDLAGKRPLVLACLGAPRALDAYPHAAATVCTFSDVPASQQALADRISR